MTPEAFAALPLDDQIDHLRRVKGPSRNRDLLELCAAVRDHAPLAWLCQALMKDRWLAATEQRTWFARFLIERHETAVHKILKAMTAEGGTSPGAREHLREMLLEALRIIPLARLSSMCLIDRTLKHNWPEARDAHVAQVIARAQELLSGGLIDEVSVDLLAQVPAWAIRDLQDTARRAGVFEGLEVRRRALAKGAIKVLGDAPKAVSQANAEELLSRRVYTDPGHFLIELLQNAEDSGATTWRVIFDRTRIIVWHNGTHFDARDLVGVTSIGQTTKRKQQIGFFGVGFKSVYEVTDRPRIYSDVYRFEIADVSMPKALSAWPEDLPSEGTVLVLPLRDPDDPDRSPRALYEKARAIDPCVLFTLRRIDVLDFELTAAATGGKGELHAVHELTSEDESHSIIKQSPEGWIRAYAIQDDEYRYSLGGREAGRPDSTRIMVGVLLDEQGAPTPLPESASTVYSYLPTSEHSGLRFFVQGHFDVPVDRERVTPDSPWNRWILRHVPTQLARVGARLIETAATPEARRKRALGLLDVLPLTTELTSPIFRIVPQRLGQALAQLPMMPCTDGLLHAPSETLVAGSDGIAALFGAEAVDRRLVDPRAEAGQLFILDPSVDARTAQVARALGCPVLDTTKLIDALERGLSGLDEGARATADWLPRFLTDGDTSGFAALYDLLLEDLEDLDRSGRTLALGRQRRRLKALPLCPDADGRLHTAAAGIARGDEDLRAVYEGLRPFIHRSLDIATEAQHTSGAARVTALLGWLEVPVLDIEHLVVDLETHLKGRRGPLADPSDAPLPGSHTRRGLILSLIAEAPPALQARAGHLPLFLAGDGKLYRAANDEEDLGGVLAVPSGPLLERLRAFYDDLRPLITPGAEEGPSATLLEHLQTPELSLEVLVADLGRSPALFKLDVARMRRLHNLLEAVSDDIPDRTRRALIELPVWPDLAGRARALRGPHAALIPSHDKICGLFPAAPFLAEEIRGQRHLKGIGVDKIGPAEVIAALDPKARPPLRIETNPDNVEAVLRFLLEHATRLGARSAERMAALPAFLSDRGRVRTLAALSLARHDALRAIYGDFQGRDFLDPEGLSAQVIQKFKLGSQVQFATASTLIEDLDTLAPSLEGKAIQSPDLPLVTNRAGLEAILGYLASQTPELTRAALTTAVSLCIYPDQRGLLGPLGGKDLEPTSVHACRDRVRPLLDVSGYRTLAPWSQGRLGPLLEASGASVADIKTAVRLLAHLKPVPSGGEGAPLQSPEMLGEVQRLLIEQRDALASSYPSAPREGLRPANPTLVALNIWRTLEGAVVSAAEIIDADEGLLALAVPDTHERREIDARRLDPEARDRLGALDGLMAPGSTPAFLATLIERLAKPMAPLSAQPGFLSSLEKIARTLSLLCPPGTDTPPQICPLADARGRLRLDRLQKASAGTLALVRGLAIHDDLLHPELSPLPPVLDKVLERVAPWEILVALDVEVEPDTSVEGHPVLGDASRRSAFYAWLTAGERDIFSDPECRKLLSDSRLFPTERGSLLTPSELVIDPDLPDLGIDWRPHPEIPPETLGLLVRHLSAGRPPIEELVQHHLRPAYIEAANKNQREQAGQILVYLARQLGNQPSARIKALLRPSGAPHLTLEDAQGVFRAPEALLLPSEEIARYTHALWGDDFSKPSPTRYPAQARRFLIKLGVLERPAMAQVRAAMEQGDLSGRALLGLVGLVGHLFHTEGQAVKTQLPLKQALWIPDGAGRARRPGSLFRWAPEIEALIGTFPELYPAESVLTLLGEPLARELGLKAARNVTIEDVVRHIDHRATSQSPVPYRVYQWMEQGLTDGWLDRRKLRELLDERTWVSSDDGGFWNHRQVLGVISLSLFGSRRGYWDWGRRNCPKLCDAFNIVSEVQPHTVAAFLGEIGRDVAGMGDRVVLEQEPALPRMLLSCYGVLGESAKVVSRNLAVILCNERGTRKKDGEQVEGGLRLMPAHTTSLLRSDTPTLEALFEEVGVMHLVARGSSGDRAAIDRFYDAMRIPRLREAYTVAVDTHAGQDRTEASSAKIQGLRGVFRGLLEVLPRVRLQRTMLSEGGWVEEARLRPLAGSGSIRAIEQLRVRYLLRGVGSVRTKVAAVFNPHKKTFLVDTEVLDRPQEHTTGLAVGLMPCVYDGQGEDQLVDIVEILLPLRSAVRMHAYLDRRHFPRAGSARGPRDRLAERLGDIVAYGLHHQLARRFDALSGRDLRAWEAPDLLDRLSGEDDNAARMAQRATRLLLDVVGLEDPPEALSSTLNTLMSVASLDELPEGFLRAPQQGAQPDLAPIEAIEAPAGATSTTTTGKAPISEALDSLLKNLTRRRRDRTESDQGAASTSSSNRPHFEVPPPDPFETEGGEREPARRILERLADSDRALVRDPGTGRSVPWQPRGPWRDALGDEALDIKSLADQTIERLPKPIIQASEGAPAQGYEPGAFPGQAASEAPKVEPVQVGTVRPSMWDRFTQWLGVSGPTIVEQTEAPIPSWANQGGNCFEPGEGIAPQLWATHKARTAVASTPTIAGLTFEPRRLPVPYIYSVHAFGVGFDPETQRWDTRALPPMSTLAPCKPTGRTAVFEGRLMPGTSHLPIPLYAQVHKTPTVVGGDPNAIEDIWTDPKDNAFRMKIGGEMPVLVRYEVDLLSVPSLTSRHLVEIQAAGALTEPTLAFGDLPRELRQWIAAQKARRKTWWERAIATQHFVQRRYLYDDDFMERPEVARKLAALRHGQGHHHLELLHASADDEFLGRGICYELNSMVLEILRHMGVPCVLATGWVLNQGRVDRPDHLFALALLPSAQGPCLFPLDAATGRQGPLRPLSLDPLPGLDVAPPTISERPPVPEVAGPWSAAPVLNAADDESLEHLLNNLKDSESRLHNEDAAILVHTIQLVCQARDQPVPEEVQAIVQGEGIARDKRDALYQVAERLLGSPSALGAMMGLLRDETRQFSTLPPAVQELVRLGLVEVHTVPIYEVTPLKR